MLVDAAFAGGYHGFREGNLLGLLYSLFERMDAYFGLPSVANKKTLVGNCRRQLLRDAVRQIFKLELNELNKQSPWLDKTCNPETILLAPELVQMWPNCRIIFARRRAIENILSRLKKFPERNFQFHCRDWARCMYAWRCVRDELEPWRYLEVDQRDLVVQPEIVARAMAKLLKLDDKAIGRISDSFRNLRPQQTAPGTTDRVVPLSDTPWTPPQIAAFNDICGTEMEAYGYSLDGAYWKKAAA
jgi:hypothetical protein